MSSDNPSRLSILAQAAAVTGGERADSYGPVKGNLGRIAVLWSSYVSAKLGEEVVLSAEDVAWMMTMLKAARAMGTNYHEDNYVDAAAYAAIAGECAK